ncbi:DUF6795 domain-containing protein [Shewanella waksmanii]|uniref:DUF6795 domain-containing protein n=1 Tax=Shewanella waksmanii TaxID=213783 RepID=UPI0004B22ED7|nr:DUF6795 domain-containing protein [Shewanella waksmanii]
MRYKGLLGLGAALFLLLASHAFTKDSTMLSMFKKAVDVEVFPAVSGSIVLHGKPMAGLKLRRGYLYLNVTEEGVWDETVTDDKGQFSFSDIVIQSKHPTHAFSTNIIQQVIQIYDDNYPEYKEVYLWSTNSTGIKQNSFFIERLSQLHCDLSDDVIYHQIIDEQYKGAIRFEIDSICRWPSLEALEAEKREKYGEL